MVILEGRSVSNGYAWGKIRFIGSQQAVIEKKAVADVEAEVARFTEACETVIADLEVVYEKALERVGEEEAFIFQIHQMMLQDDDYRDHISGLIRNESINAEYAVQDGMEYFQNYLAESPIEYIAERAADVKDISSQIISVLSNADKVAATEVDGKFIIAADDLTPSETILLNPDDVLAIITARGSKVSHTAILAKSMGIPAIVGIGAGCCMDLDGEMAAVDCSEQTVYIDPDESHEADIRAKIETAARESAELEQFRGKASLTADGRQIHLYANAASIEDVENAVAADAEGIGLFRSEFLFLESDEAPDEDHQFEVYRKVAELMQGKTVIIRTLDAGADKHIPYLNSHEEENPALGVRGLRICLQKPDVFQTQLRAILRASTYGAVHVMFPMVSTEEDIILALDAVAQAKASLDAEGIAYDKEIPVGIMIETPASALISDRLAPHVDFFSIGTNDLSQYTLAVDRQNRDLEGYLAVHHESVLRLIEMTIENSHKHGIWTGICGELAGETDLTETFVKYGVDELSVAPPLVLSLRKHIGLYSGQEE